MTKPPAALPATTTPPAEPPDQDQAAVAAPPAQPEGLVLAKDFDELELIEEQLLATRLSGEESVEAYLYVIMPSRDNRLTEPVIGPTADFAQQLVRRMNRASKGKVDLRVAPEPPIVTDFQLPLYNDKGEVVGRRDMVRVTVPIIDKVTGEVRHGIKEAPRRGLDPVNNAYTKAIRRGFEIHPSYNRKVVARFIREKIRSMGYTAALFNVVGERGGGQWDAFFAAAREKGVKSDTVRAGVRQRTGRGLSEAKTAAQVDQAAQAIHDTVDAATAAPAAGAEAPSPAAASPSNTPASGAAVSTAPPPAAEAAAQVPEQVSEFQNKIADLVNHMHLADSSVNRIKRAVYDPEQLLENWARLFVALQHVSVGQTAEEGIAAALQTYPRTNEPAPF